MQLTWSGACLACLRPSPENSVRRFTTLTAALEKGRQRIGKCKVILPFQVGGQPGLREILSINMPRELRKHIPSILLISKIIQKFSFVLRTELKIQPETSLFLQITIILQLAHTAENDV